MPKARRAKPNRNGVAFTLYLPKDVNDELEELRRGGATKAAILIKAYRLCAAQFRAAAALMSVSPKNGRSSA